MSEKQREAAFELISKVALDISITIVEPEEIDRINILEASRYGMENCLNNLKHEYQFALTDAVKLKKYDRPYEAIIKGDAKALCIAAASIIAKVTRDRICYELDKKYPIYNIRNNKGYGTKDHIEALEKYGPVEGLHRYSYKPVKNALIEKISLF